MVLDKKMLCAITLCDFLRFFNDSVGLLRYLVGTRKCGKLIVTVLRVLTSELCGICIVNPSICSKGTG